MGEGHTTPVPVTTGKSCSFLFPNTRDGEIIQVFLYAPLTLVDLEDDKADEPHYSALLGLSVHLNGTKVATWKTLNDKMLVYRLFCKFL